MNEQTNEAEVISILHAKKLKPVIDYLTKNNVWTIDDLHEQMPEEIFKRVLRSRTVDDYRQVVGE